MPVTLGILGLAGNVAGGIAGAVGSASDRDQALQLQKQALANILNTQNPTAAQLQAVLSQYKSAGALTPQLEQLVKQEPSLMANISTDPRLMNAAIQSLQQMQRVGEGGLRPEDLAALSQVRNQTEQQANADRLAILQQMQQRGMGGSGAELAAQLNASQAAANRANTAGLDIAGQASQRALQAIAQSGGLGAQLQAQQFGQASQQAQAQDIINRYNAMNAQQIGSQNVALQNAAQAQNLAQAQAIANANTQLANQQAMMGPQAQQQAYQDALAKAQAAAGVTNQTAGALNQAAAQQQSMFSGLGQAVGQGLTGIGANLQQQQTNQGFMDVLKGLQNKSTTAAPTTTADTSSSFNAQT